MRNSDSTNDSEIEGREKSRVNPAQDTAVYRSDTPQQPSPHRTKPLSHETHITQARCSARASHVQRSSAAHMPASQYTARTKRGRTTGIEKRAGPGQGKAARDELSRDGVHGGWEEGASRTGTWCVNGWTPLLRCATVLDTVVALQVAFWLRWWMCWRFGLLVDGEVGWEGMELWALL